MTWFIVLAGFGAGLVFGLFLVVVEFGAWTLVLPRRLTEPVPKRWRNRDVPDREHQTSTTPAVSSLEITARNSDGVIQIQAADGVRLAGRWAAAERPTGRVMLLIHGFIDGPGMMLVDRAPTILKHGWNVAAIDLRGYGASEGDFSSFGGREADDLRLWLDALAQMVPNKESFVPVVWGRSMGAAIALRSAVEDSRIRALVLEAPMVDLQASVARVMRNRRVPMAPLLSRLVLRRAGRLAGTRLDRPRPLDLAPRFDRPAVVLHGDQDDLIPTSLAHRFADAFPSRVPFLEVPGARHADVARVGGQDLIESVLKLVDEAV